MPAKRIDLNHATIRDSLRELGLLVADTHTIGHGFPDLVVGDPRTRRIVLIEVKSPGGKKTQAEQAFHAEWAGYPVYVAECVEDVLREIGW